MQERVVKQYMRTTTVIMGADCGGQIKQIKLQSQKEEQKVDILKDLCYFFLLIQKNMSILRNRISQSLKKIVSETVPEPESPQLPSPSKKAGSKFKLRLQPIQYPLKKACISPKNPQKLELRRIIKKYDSDHRPRNASRCRYDFPFPNNNSFSHEGNKYQNVDHRDHLSYDELVLQREKEDDSRRLIILKQVIKENVKRKNEQMKLNSKKRLKTII